MAQEPQVLNGNQRKHGRAKHQEVALELGKIFLLRHPHHILASPALYRHSGLPGLGFQHRCPASLINKPSSFQKGGDLGHFLFWL